MSAEGRRKKEFSQTVKTALASLFLLVLLLAPFLQSTELVVQEEGYLQSDAMLVKVRVVGPLSCLYDVHLSLPSDLALKEVLRACKLLSQEVVFKVTEGSQTALAPTIQRGVAEARIGRLLNKTSVFFMLIKSNSSAKPVFSSNAILLEFNPRTSRARIWEWHIESPHNISYWLFLSPRVENLRPLTEYMEYQLYVGRITPREGVWWPLRGVGPSSLNTTLKQLLEVIDLSEDCVLFNVSRWPSRYNGVSIAYEGELKSTRLAYGKLLETKLCLGFTERPTLIVLLPGNVRLLSLQIAGEIYTPGNCIYSSGEEYSNCYAVAVNKTLAGPSTVRLLFLEN